MPAQVIAIDGPSASGKGTIARRLASYYDFAYLDTGLLYRATGYLANERKIPLDDEKKLAEFIADELGFEMVLVQMESPVVRSEEAAQWASKVAAVPAVRTGLLKFQQDFCSTPPHGKKGAVLDGRDIGTVIAPDAAVKIFVTASLEIRAKRRFGELKNHTLQPGREAATEAAVLADMKERDDRDISRAVAPAKAAPDAVTIDTTNMTVEEAFAAALEIAESKIKQS